MKNSIPYIIIGLLVICICSLLLCCNTFKPIWIEELPPECNMYLNVNKMYYSAKDKSATVPAYDYCIKKLHRKSCQAEVFGVDDKGEPLSVNYDDPKLYRSYTQCLAELR